MVKVITGSIARRSKRQYISYLEGDFEGRHVAPMGVKFAVEQWTRCTTHAKFLPIGATIRV